MLFRSNSVIREATKEGGTGIFKGKSFEVGTIKFILDSKSGFWLAADTKIEKKISINQPILQWAQSQASSLDQTSNITPNIIDILTKKLEGYCDVTRMILREIILMGPSASVEVSFGKKLAVEAGAKLAQIIFRVAMPTGDSFTLLDCGFSVGAKMGIASIQTHKGKAGYNKEKSFSLGVWEVKISSEPKQIVHSSSSKSNHLMPANKKSISLTTGRSSMRKNKQTVSKPVNAQQLLESYGVANDSVSADTRTELDTILVQLDAQSEMLARQETRAEQAHAGAWQIARMQAAKQTFSKIGELGVSLNNKTLINIAAVGQVAIKVGESLSQLAKVSNFLAGSGIFSGALSSLVTLNPYVAVISGLVQMGMSLFGNKKNDAVFHEMMKNIKLVLENVQQLRKEMHQRFDHIEETLEQLLKKIDTVYYALNTVIMIIEINHQKESRNIAYGIEEISKDIKFSERLLSNIVKEGHLDELVSNLNKVKYHINMERREFSFKKNSEDIFNVKKNLDDMWLRRNLIRSTYNGHNYFSGSRRQDRHFLGDGIQYIGETLGYLIPYAVQELGVQGGAMMTYGDRLPNVDLWILALSSTLSARLYDTQAYGSELTDDIKDLETIAATTVRVIDELTVNYEALFSRLLTNYSGAAIQLRQSAIQEIAEQILRSRQVVFSLRNSIHNGWINLSNLQYRKLDGTENQLRTLREIAEPLKNGRQNTMVCRPLGDMAVSDAFSQMMLAKLGDFQIPVVLLLAMKFGIASLELTCNLARVDAYKPASYDINRGGKHGVRCQHELYTDSAASMIKVLCHVVNNQSPTELIFVTSKYPRRLRDYEETGGGKNHSDRAHLFGQQAVDCNQASDESVLERTVIDQVGIHSIDSLVNKLSPLVAREILKRKQDGTLSKILNNETLLNSCESYYQQACDSLNNNVAEKDRSLDVMHVMSVLARSYAELIGFPPAIDEKLRQAMQSNFWDIMHNPQYFNQIQTHTEDLLATMRTPTSLINSTVRGKMLGALEIIKNHRVVVNLYNGYREQLAQWEQDAGKLTDIENIILHMQAIHQSNPSFFNLTLLQELIKGCSILMGRLQVDRQNLLDMHAQLIEFGFDLNLPREIFINCFNTHLVSTETQTQILIASQEKMQADSAELGFSIEDTIYLLEEMNGVINAYQARQESVIFLFGKTGNGKSTLLNFMNGTEYEKQGRIRSSLKPINTVQEVSPTSDASISATKYPVMYQVSQDVYVDMPGFDDTSGKGADIRTGVGTQLIASKCDSIKAIVVVCKESCIEDARYSELRETFKKVGLMFAKNPNQLMSHFVLAITAPAQVGNSQTYEEDILAELKKWYEKEIKHSLEEQDEGIKIILENLQARNIIVMQADNPDSRARFNARLQVIENSSVAQNFNFARYHDCSEMFKRFLAKIQTYRQSLDHDSKRYISALAVDWVEKIDIDNLFDTINIDEFAAEENLAPLLSSQYHAQENHAEIARLANRLFDELNYYVGENGVVGTDQQVLQEAIRMLHESAVNVEFFNRIDNIAAMMGIPVEWPPIARLNASMVADYQLPEIHLADTNVPEKAAATSVTIHPPQAHTNLHHLVPARLLFFSSVAQDASVVSSSDMWGSVYSSVSEVEQNSQATPSRSGLTNVDNFTRQLYAQLPAGFVLGQAQGQGDCFFDALAQCVNQINNTDVNTDKYLRMVCHDFYLKNKSKVDHWNLRDWGGVDKGKDEYYFVQYTAEECEKDLYKRPAMWGRAHVEGIILCEQLGLKGILIIEILEDPNTKQPAVGFHLVANGTFKSISTEEAQAWMNNRKVPTLVVEQNSLHFVPLLTVVPVAENSPETEFSKSPRM